MAEKDKGIGLMIGIGPSKPEAGAEESTEETSPGLEAAKALIKAIKGGNAQAVLDAFATLVDETDFAAEETEEPAEDIELDD
jgi:hypothetical protein